MLRSSLPRRSVLRASAVAASAGLLAVGIVAAVTTAPTAPRSSAASAPAAAPAIAAAAGEAKPNVLVVMLDDMRSDEMRFAPNARKYVRSRGLDFRNSFSPYPLCCPARASFLLGKYAHNHRVLYHEAPYGFGALDDHLTVAGRMQAAGYQTALVGKYLNKYGDQKSRVTGRASQHYVPAGWTDWMVGLETRWPKGSGLHGNTYNYFDFTQNINGKTVMHPGKYSSNVIGTEVRGLITKYHRSSKPFFLWVTPVAPHHGGPRESDDPAPYREASGRVQKFVTPARPGWVKGRFDKQVTHAFGQPVHGPAEADVRDKPRNISRLAETTPTEKRRLRDTERQRAESIYAWDVEFGKIVQRLKDTGEYANTVIMFTSDNGYYLGEHRQRLGKIKAHEPVLHVPLAVAGPGIGAGARYTPVTTFDLTATILDLGGAQPLPAMDGASQAGVLRGPDRDWDTAVVTEGLLPDLRRKSGTGVPAGFTTSGLRTGRYKLIRYSTGEAELYDLFRDPNELTSVWKDPAYAGVRAQLTALWAKYRSCAGAACRAELPKDLRTTPSELAQQWSTAERAKARYYGR
ncbi:sulfatase-like hydrolase/transferase [Marmoricola sp. RAF53]|uniref:sulfatase-like hydrolase/transferase n=1 Tax=Marmoricola sp. RAF53 TaxID=3233059 RepID=UPI003F95702A